MEAGPHLEEPQARAFTTSSARQRLMGQITAPATLAALPSLSLECEEQLEDSSRQVTSPYSPPCELSEREGEEQSWALCLQGLEPAWEQLAYETLLSRVSCLTRAILLDWVCEVCADYGLKRETYYLACSFIGRYLIKCSVTKADLQLLAISSLSLAAKAEEELSPRISQLVQSCSNAFSAIQIKSMEQRILCALSWRLYLVTPACGLHCLMARWDYFLAKHFSAYTQQGEAWVSFTDWTMPARERLQRAFWVLDAGLMLPQVLTFSMLEYTATVFYLSVCYAFQVTSYALLKAATTVDPACSEFALCKAVDDLFSLFLSQTCGLEVEQLHPRVSLLVPLFYRVGEVGVSAETGREDERERKLWPARQRHYAFTLQDISRMLKTT